MNHSPRDGKSPTVVWRWRWKAFGVFFFRKEMMSWQQHCEWEIQNWTKRPCTVFFRWESPSTTVFFFFLFFWNPVEVSTTSPTRQALFDDFFFFGTFWRLTKTQPHFVGKKGFLQFKRGTRSSQRSSFEASGFIAFSPVFQLENLEKLGEVAA